MCHLFFNIKKKRNPLVTNIKVSRMKVKRWSIFHVNQGDYQGCLSDSITSFHLGSFIWWQLYPVLSCLHPQRTVTLKTDFSGDLETWKKRGVSSEFPDLHMSLASEYLGLPCSSNGSSMQETRVQSLGQEDPLEKGMAIHSSILAWRIPWTEMPGGLQSVGSQRVGHNWVTNTHTCMWISCCNYWRFRTHPPLLSDVHWETCLSRLGFSHCSAWADIWNSR